MQSTEKQFANLPFILFHFKCKCNFKCNIFADISSYKVKVTETVVHAEH